MVKRESICTQMCCRHPFASCLCWPWLLVLPRLCTHCQIRHWYGFFWNVNVVDTQYFQTIKDAKMANPLNQRTSHCTTRGISRRVACDTTNWAWFPSCNAENGDHMRGKLQFLMHSNNIWCHALHNYAAYNSQLLRIHTCWWLFPTCYRIVLVAVGANFGF